ncbi:MAG: hypothetical protein KatS3mg100_664 [Candidatus Parcubacteria bacterium]|nr:MAG: hypothetical protein KatS3mg100_664 [Candidatus Parcubacteria bacterium]
MIHTMLDLQSAGIVLVALGWVWEAYRTKGAAPRASLALPSLMLAGGAILATGEYAEGSIVGAFGAAMLALASAWMLLRPVFVFVGAQGARQEEAQNHSLPEEGSNSRPH